MSKKNIKIVYYTIYPLAIIGLVLMLLQTFGVIEPGNDRFYMGTFILTVGLFSILMYIRGLYKKVP